MASKKQEREWLVPVEVTLRGHVIIKATDPDAIVDNDILGTLDDEFMASAEFTDWGITGEPELNE